MVFREPVWREGRRMAPFLVAFVVLSVVGGALLSAYGQGDQPAADRSGVFASIVLLAVPLSVGLLGVAAMRQFARGAGERNLTAFRWSERRAVRKAVKAGRPLTDREAAVARATLDTADRTWSFAWAWPVVAICYLLNGLMNREGGARSLMAGLSVVFVVVMSFGTWRQLRGSRLYRAALARRSSA